MNPITAAAIFFVMWWVLLFATLPFGMRTQDEEGEVVLGTVSSAPAKPRMVRKLLINTLITTIVFGAFWVATQKFGLSFETFDFLGPQG